MKQKNFVTFTITFLFSSAGRLNCYVFYGIKIFFSASFIFFGIAMLQFFQSGGFSAEINGQQQALFLSLNSIVLVLCLILEIMDKFRNGIRMSVFITHLVSLSACYGLLQWYGYRNSMTYSSLDLMQLIYFTVFLLVFNGILKLVSSLLGNCVTMKVTVSGSEE